MFMYVKILGLGKSFFAHGMGESFFLSNQVTHSLDLDFFTDAAGKIEYGGYFQGAWFYHNWSLVDNFCFA